MENFRNRAATFGKKINAKVFIVFYIFGVFLVFYVIESKTLMTYRGEFF